MPPLNPNGTPIQVGRAVLRTPGLVGVANEIAAAGPTTRGATRTSAELEAVLTAHGIFRSQVIELSQTRTQPAPAASTRGTRWDGPAIELEVPDLGEQAGQVVLATDEGGITTWHLPRDRSNAPTTTRGGGTRTFLIKSAVAPPPATGAGRGVIATVGTKLLQVLVFPITDPLIGAISETFARRWEEKNRPYQLRSFRAAEHTQPAPGDLRPDEIAAMAAAGPVLLFVHGTFSRAHRVFDSVPLPTMTDLDQRYGGRLIALDHFTISDDPLTNARWFAKALPEGTALTLDVVTHSRGGLVGRSLAEQSSQLQLGSRAITVRNLVFAGSPNAGCVLADPDYMTHFADRYTNWVGFLPTSGVLEVLEGVVAVIKQLAVAGMKGLVGLESMVPKPGGTFLKGLNAAGGTSSATYHAFASDYEPPDVNLKAFAHNALMDALFSGPNDLVVPTGGVYDRNDAPNFPIAAADLVLFGPTDSVDHGGYFSHPSSQAKLLSWLPG